MNLSPKFDLALQYAVLVHAGQIRKGSGVPYIAHLLGVASITLENGGREDEAIGALLHDAGEDAGGVERAKTVVLAYGAPPKNLQQRGQEVVELLAEHPDLTCLKLAKDGFTPIHPLYLPANIRPHTYRKSVRKC